MCFQLASLLWTRSSNLKEGDSSESVMLLETAYDFLKKIDTPSKLLKFGELNKLTVHVSSLKLQYYRN